MLSNCVAGALLQIHVSSAMSPREFANFLSSQHIYSAGVRESQPRVGSAYPGDKLITVIANTEGVGQLAKLGAACPKNIPESWPTPSV